MAKPDPSEYNPFFERYIGEVSDGDILEILTSQLESFVDFLDSIGEERASLRYASGKWSIKQVVGHVVDTERIFGARALAIVRGERAPLPPFEQDEYVEEANFDDRTLASLTAEFENLRRSHLVLFRSFDDRLWLRKGMAGGNEVSVRAIAWILAGHLIHHEGVVRDLYL
jgi:uncharacterized damage-inducible protein DinB